jgi:hypothetical protein
LAVPARTPREVVLRLNREIETILQMPDVKKRLSDVNVNVQGGTPEQAAEIAGVRHSALARGDRQSQNRQAMTQRVALIHATALAMAPNPAGL